MLSPRSTGGSIQMSEELLTVALNHKTNHYENMPMKYTEIFKVVKNEKFQVKNFDIFLIFAQNIDCWYTLEPSRQGGSNEYPIYVLGLK